MSRKTLAALALVAFGFTAPVTVPAADKVEEGFKVIFDGKSLDGWKINEKKETWTLKDGMLIAKGDRSHIFYVGDDKPFKNFELKVDCKAENNSNGGIYFHTKFQEEGWPKYGFEAQVNNSYNSDPRKSGSLYAVSDVKEQHIPDGEWWTETITVKDKHVTIKLNDKVVVDYEEPADKVAGNDFTRKIDSGTFALQGHDPGSTVYYKNIRVKRLD
ncbi:DUF1080 domain-containing protein [Planctomyces sp. SH-PL14]|uniref:3-keto-disaccharide hydrolase n=1 Tax=Planctomyces sp. SH-PL14 TaxID=1632864 RepID=UPI00078E034B|nr:DUF1080 domain-containing protein [Planctomyces sp. SH-PL14]AMV18981.1 hypothetical protein VT03_13915 [Planctomyces sp. SH-PL14]